MTIEKTSEQRNAALPQMADPVRTQESLAELHSILRRSAIPGINTIEALDQLVDHVGEGFELFNIPDLVTAEILYHAALTRLQQGASGSTTQHYLDRLIGLDIEPERRMLLQAWQAYNRNAINEALGLLASVETPDARAQILKMYLRQQDRIGVINWFVAEAPKGIDNLPAPSWHEMASTLAKSGLWDEAAELLAQLNESHYQECPDLYYLEGIINLGLLLPPVQRSKILYRQLFGIKNVFSKNPAASHFRERAQWALSQAEQQLRACAAPERAEKALRLRTWLMLTEEATHEQGVAIVKEAMHDPERAGLYIELAAEFSIHVHTKVLQRFLNKRALIAGFDADEIAARFFFLKYIGNHAELIRFLTYEQEKLQRRVFDIGTWTDFLIHELLAADRFARAESLLFGYRETLTEDFPKWQQEIAHLRCNLATPFQRFIEDESNDNLQAVCEHLQTKNDAVALKPFILELFRRSPTKENAVAVARCLSRTRDDLLLFSFLEENFELTDTDPYLTQRYAWCLHYQGNVSNVDVRETADAAADPRAELLPIFNAFIACDWQQLETLALGKIAPDADFSADDFLLLALIAAPLDKTRAVELITHAVDLAGDKPRLLTQAYNLMVNIGEKIPATPWLYRAVCSHRDNGPAWQYGYNQIVDMVSNARECPSTLWTHAIEAHFPVSLASQALHYPLTELLISHALANEQDSHCANHKLIPLHLARHGTNDLAMARSIAMDFGALLIAESLQLWPYLTRRFETIAIPFSTAGMLREESLKLQHGQLPRFENVSNILHHIDSGSIETLLPVALRPPLWLISEIGETRAQLLHAAHINQGKVILPTPVFKIYSMACEEAELRDYSAYIVSTHQCVDVLATSLSPDKHRTAKSYLSDMDTDHVHSMPTNHQGPIYLDELALVYLTDTQVLNEVLDSGHQYFIHPTTITYLRDSITTASYREDSLRLLDALQRRLQQGIAAGNIILTARQKNKYNAHTHAGAVVELLDGRTIADCYWIDDRSLNSRSRTSDQEDRRQKNLVSTLDVLDELSADNTLLDDATKFQLRMTLRRRCYFAIPLELQELQFWLQQSTLDTATGELVESEALRTLRHYTDQLMANQVLQLPLEAHFMDRLHLTALVAIRDTWAQADISPELARARSSWVLDKLFPKLTQWRHALEPAMNLYFFEDTTAMSGAAFLALQPVDAQRTGAYVSWLHDTLLTPLRGRNWPVIEKTAELHAKQLVSAISGETAAGGSVTTASLQTYIDALPTLLQTAVGDNPDICGIMQRTPSESVATETFSALHASIQSVLAAPVTDLSQLLPTDTAYYEALCGKPIDYYEEPDYLSRILHPHFQQLLQMDTELGLTIALPAGVFNGSRARHALKDMDNDTLWHALTTAGQAADPISLLNLLDLSLARNDDARFQEYSHELLARLEQGPAPEPSWNV